MIVRPRTVVTVGSKPEVRFGTRKYFGYVSSFDQQCNRLVDIDAWFLTFR